MGRKEEEELCNTENEEETVARQKKRSRRVSFAEITSVHVFDRDEDYETPLDTNPCFNDSQLGQSDEVLGFPSDPADSDDSKEDFSQNEEEVEEDGDCIVDGRKHFLRPVGSPSPGSTIGSATSNDENSFFGPVSSSFIKPGCLSDSATSNENHDITMDSTAFSMHFRSLAFSDLAEDVRTPTGVCLAFEEKTLTQSPASTNVGSFMVFTGARKPISQSSVPVDKVKGDADSNDMSLVGQNPYRYDFGKLSPRLDALLAEGSTDVHPVSISDDIVVTKSSDNLKRLLELSKLDRNGADILDHKDGEDIKSDHMSAEKQSVAHTRLGELGGDSSSSINQASLCIANSIDVPVADTSIDQQFRSPNLPTKMTPLSQQSIKITLERGKLKLISAINSGTIAHTKNKVLQPGLFAMHESGHLSSAEAWGKENCPKEGKLNSDVDQNSNQHSESLSENSSFLSARKRKILFDPANSSQQPGVVTPSPKQLGSFWSIESIKHGDSESSIQRSTATFEIPKVSPNASALKDRPVNSIEKSSDYLSRTLPSDMKESSTDPQPKCLGENSLSVGQKSEEYETIVKIDDSEFWTPKNIGEFNQIEETIVPVKDGESIHHMSVDVMGQDNRKLLPGMASPSQFTLSGSKQCFLMPDSSTDGIGGSTSTDLSALETSLDYWKNEKFSGTLDKFACPPVKKLKKISASPSFISSLSRDLRQRDNYNKLDSSASGQDTDSTKDVSIPTKSAAMAEQLDFLLKEREVQSSLSFTEIKHSKDIAHIESKVNFYAMQNDSGAFENFTAPLSDKDALEFQSVSKNRNFLTVTDPAGLVKERTGGRIKSSLFQSASPHARQCTDEEQLQKSPSRSKLTHSPLKKELNDALDSDRMNPFTGKDILSLTSSEFTEGNGGFQGLDVLLKRGHLRDIESSSGWKSNEDRVLRNRDCVDDIARIQSSRVLKGGSYDLKFPLECSDGRNREAENIEHDAKLKHWADIFPKFSGATKQLLSPLADDLNLQAIGVLQDIVVHLQKVKTWESMCSEICCPKIFDPSRYVRQRSIAEAKLFLYKVAYEHAKLQLMHLKQKQLVKRAQLLSNGIQKFQMLKLTHFHHLPVPGADVSQINDSLPILCSVNFESKCELFGDKVIAMRQELEHSDREIENLTKSFHEKCKIKEEPNCVETISLVNDCLRRRMCCRFIRQDLQLWEIDDLEKRDGHHHVVLNYNNSIFQRFTFIAGPVSSINVSNKLNHANIVKKFPNMDACNIFAFVLNAETNQKYVGPRSLAGETQKTGSLLSNLLDVVEEVQLSQIELRNLTRTSFYSPSAEQLDLELCFVDFKSGKKAVLTLDVTSMNQGVYPSEILPSRLSASGADESLPVEISAAVGSLRAGYKRIIRLCRTVSQVIEASSRYERQ